MSFSRPFHVASDVVVSHCQRTNPSKQVLVEQVVALLRRCVTRDVVKSDNLGLQESMLTFWEYTCGGFLGKS